MPAFYAHHRFGERVLPLLGAETKATVLKYRNAFNIGLQGPDIFFFYRPYKKNSINQYGESLHSASAYSFFTHAADIIRQRGCDSGEYAYLLGFLCHFILDSECHPYVDEMIEKTGVQHMEIEEEFEKLLLREDGHDALAFPLAGLVPEAKGVSRYIYPFYTVNIEDIEQSLKDLKSVKRLFTAPGALKQGVINTAMKLTGNYTKYKGQMNQRKDNPACIPSNKGLSERFDSAVPLAVKMAESLENSIKSCCALDKRFDRTFE